MLCTVIITSRSGTMKTKAAVCVHCLRVFSCILGGAGKSGCVYFQPLSHREKLYWKNYTSAINNRPCVHREASAVYCEVISYADSPTQRLILDDQIDLPCDFIA